MNSCEKLNLEYMQISVYKILRELEDVHDDYNVHIAHLHGLIVQGNDLEYKEKEYWHKTICNAISKLQQRLKNCLNGLDYLSDLNDECSVNFE